MTGTGVDLSVSALDRARQHADAQGIDVRWVPGDAATWTEGPYEAIICVGASHAFGGLDGTLAAVRRLLRPGGRVLIGDTIWERRPSDVAQQALDAGPNDFPDLAGLVERVLQNEFEVLDGHVSTLEEWDDYGPGRVHSLDGPRQQPALQPTEPTLFTPHSATGPSGLADTARS